MVNTSNWTGWRLEEKQTAERVLAGLRKSVANRTARTVKANLADSYFLRDVVVAYLDSHASDAQKVAAASELLAARVASALGLTGIDLTPTIAKSVSLWAKD